MELLHFKDSFYNRDVISLFSGAMGLDIGLAEVGLNIKIEQDFEPTCVETMRTNGHNVLGGDIRNFFASFPKEEIGEIFRRICSNRLWAGPTIPAGERWGFTGGCRTASPLRLW